MQLHPHRSSVARVAVPQQTSLRYNYIPLGNFRLPAYGLCRFSTSPLGYRCPVLVLDGLQPLSFDAIPHRFAVIRLIEDEGVYFSTLIDEQKFVF